MLIVTACAVLTTVVSHHKNSETTLKIIRYFVRFVFLTANMKILAYKEYVMDWRQGVKKAEAEDEC